MEFPIAVTPSANVTDLIRLLEGNKFARMLTFGIVTLVSIWTSENTELPILVTLLGIVTLVRPLHQWNALSPMLVTLFGIVTFVRLLQP
jgi:hypothetical protein